MAVAIKVKQRKAKPKSDRSLDITAIAIGMRDAYYHFPVPMRRKDMAFLACNFAMKSYEMLCKTEEQKAQWDFIKVFDNYAAGYKLGNQQCASMQSKEHKKILANFYKTEAEEGDMGLFLIFSSFKEEVEDFVLFRNIKNIDDFTRKLEKGELVWQSK